MEAVKCVLLRYPADVQDLMVQVRVPACSSPPFFRFTLTAFFRPTPSPVFSPSCHPHLSFPALSRPSFPRSPPSSLLSLLDFLLFPFFLPVCPPVSPLSPLCCPLFLPGFSARGCMGWHGIGVMSHLCAAHPCANPRSLGLCWRLSRRSMLGTIYRALQSLSCCDSRFLILTHCLVLFVHRRTYLSPVETLSTEASRSVQSICDSWAARCNISPAFLPPALLPPTHLASFASVSFASANTSRQLCLRQYISTALPWPIDACFHFVGTVANLLTHIGSARAHICTYIPSLTPE